MTKTYKTHTVKEHIKQQHCPTCNRYVKYSERYPDYVCDKCVSLATDKEGKVVGFYNITHSGYGCQGKYLESGKLYRPMSCFINGIKCYAEEAYFGGVVIRPLKRKRKTTINRSKINTQTI